MERALRVFVSSTFRDLQAEREQLVKRVFPRLRKLCEARGATFTDIDLRWGVSDEQKAEGKVLPICLEEIRGSRPFFIAVLGERYGWVPDAVPEDVLHSEPWLADDRDRSVTELEILHGVLNDPDMAQHAFFYFRDPRALERLPAGANPADYRPESLEAAAKVARLKDRIRAAHHPVREDFRDAQELGALVERDFSALIDFYFPLEAVPDATDAAARRHEAFAANRRLIYVGREEDLARLDALVDGGADEAPSGGLVVVGASGLGKSALLANWAARRRRTHPDELLIQHFTGADAESTDGAALLRRLLAELARRREIEVPPVEHDSVLPAVFGRALAAAASKGPLVLLVDALDQIAENGPGPDAAWIPETLPDGVRVIASALPGGALDTLARRGWPQLAVRPLAEPDRVTIARDYLAQYRKTLDGPRLARIAGAPATENPLYLRALLDELRVLGAHEKLDAEIDRYLSAETPERLYASILERYEHDYESERPGLVRDAFTLLWAAREGLAEAELLEMLDVPRAVWSPLYLAAEASLVSRAGLLSFSHDYLRRAVEARWLTREPDRLSAHRRIAAFFATRVGERGARTLDELPWQLAAAGDWEELADLLAAPDFAAAVIDRSPLDVRRWWTRIEDATPRRIVDAYREVIGAPDRFPELGTNLANMLVQMGHLAEAFRIHEAIVARYRRQGNREGLAGELGNLATSAQRLGDSARACVLLEEQVDLAQELGDLRIFQLALGNLSSIAVQRGEWEKALRLLATQEQICREHGLAHLVFCLGMQASVRLLRGEYDEAMRLCKEQETLARRTGDQLALRGCLGCQAQIFSARGRTDEALTIHRESERIARDVGDMRALTTALDNIAACLLDRGELDAATAVVTEKVELCRRAGDRAGLMTGINKQGLVLLRTERFAEAQAKFEEYLHLACELRDPVGEASAIGNLGTLARKEGDASGALAKMRQAAEILRRCGQRENLQRVLIDMAPLLPPDEALPVLDEAEAVCRSLGSPKGLLGAVSFQAMLLLQRGQSDVALLKYDEQVRLARQVGSEALLVSGLFFQSSILIGNGRVEAALVLLSEHEQIVRRSGDLAALEDNLKQRYRALKSGNDSAGTLAALHELAQVLKSRGNLDDASTALSGQWDLVEKGSDRQAKLAVLAEWAELCRERKAWDEMGPLLHNSGVLSYEANDFDSAAGFFEQEESCGRSAGDWNRVWNTLVIQADLLSTRDPRRCIAVLERQGHLLRALRAKPGNILAVVSRQRALAEGTGDRALMGNAAAFEALILEQAGDADAALARYREAAGHRRAGGDRAGLVASLGDARRLLVAKGDHASARPLVKEALMVARIVGDPVLVASALEQKASLPLLENRWQDAAADYEELEQLRRAGTDRNALQRCLGNRALILRDQGDLDGALALHREEAAICAELGDHYGAACSLLNQGSLEGRTNTDRAIALYRDCAAEGHRAKAPRIIHAALEAELEIHVARGDRDAALAVREQLAALPRDGDDSG